MNMTYVSSIVTGAGHISIHLKDNGGKILVTKDWIEFYKHNDKQPHSATPIIVRPPEMLLNVEKSWTENMGGGCMSDIIKVASGHVIALNDECVFILENEKNLDMDEYDESNEISGLWYLQPRKPFPKTDPKDTYTFNLQYALYYAADVTVEARSVDEAFDRAMEESEDADFRGLDVPGPTFVSLIVKGGVDNAYLVPHDDARLIPVPHRMTEEGMLVSDAAVLKRTVEMVEAIAKRFLVQLKEDIGETAYRHFLKQTIQNPPPRGVCYSHEYCDANMTMHEAHQHVLGPQWEHDAASEEHAQLWGQAWDRAIELVMYRKGEQA